MGLVRLQNVCKQFGGQIVLDDVTLDLHTGQTAALVGANGAGKTTLFKLIAGLMKPDTGTVTLSRDLEVGYLPQEPDLASDATLRDAVAEAFADLAALEHRLQALAEQMAHAAGPALDDLMHQYDRLRARFEAAGGYRFEQRLNEVLGGLGFQPTDYQLPVRVLSGGQKCRAALARLLLQERQFLLLDEPTNHLDIDAVRWLEKFLASHHGGALIISHDRYLLDRLAERTIELASCRVTSYIGNYSQFVQTQAERELALERQYEKDSAFIAKERAYIARYLAGQRARQAQGRRTRLERQLAAGEFVLRKSTSESGAARLRFDAPQRPVQHGKEVVYVEGLAKAYGDRRLFSGLDLAVYTGQRLGITGPNGTGKTTLLRILLGQIEADAGTVRRNPAARVGYFAQDAVELDPQLTVIDEIRAIRTDFLERDARHYAARFLFTGEDPFKRIGTLSGGEQSRVRFMKLILAAPDVLVLDEPTNHLDIPSREALEAALADFEGTLIAVSHDRYFLDETVEQLLVLRPEGHRLVRGSYSAYVAELERERVAAEEMDLARATEAASKRRRTPARSSSKAGSERSPFARMKLAELEAYIAEREQRRAMMNARFAEPEVYRDAGEIIRLRAEYDALQAELAAAEEAWLERAE